MIFALAYLPLIVPCGAKTITADNGGPADLNNIQKAINSANEGDTTLKQNRRGKLP
jgi:hypothetical protein